VPTARPFASPPAEDDDDAFVFIDHREEETAIVEYVSERLAPEDALEVEEDDEQIAVRHRGTLHRVPLQMSPHDRYIMISSLAVMLAGRYRFFLHKPSLDGDTHGLLVVPESDALAWGAVPDHLVPLALGHDYFNDLRVPYLNHETQAPDFDRQRERLASQKVAMGGLTEALLTGKMDARVADNLAQLAATDADGKPLSPEESRKVADDIRQALDEAMASPEMDAHRRELQAAMSELQGLTRTPPAKPWWKLW
jgi:hypothetical protein